MDCKFDDYNMFQSFKVKARWFFDNKQNDASYGLLNYNAGQNSIIKISPAFCNREDQFNNPSLYKVKGLCENGEIIRGNGYRVGSFFNSSGLSVEKVQLFDFSIDNFYYQTLAPKLVNFSATDFNYWLPNQKFSIPDKGIGIVVDPPQAVKIGSIKYNDQEYNLKIGYANSSNQRNDNHIFYIRMKTFLMLESSQILNHDVTVQLIQKIIKLYEIIAEPASLKEISYIDGRKIRKLFPSSNYDIFFDNMYNPNLFFLDYADVQSELLTVINRWLNSSKEFQLLVDDYLLTVNYKSVIENDLINYTQGIESYFRNERLNLSGKINKLIDELPESYRELLFNSAGNKENWVSDIVNTRVFLTHGDRESKAISNPYKLVQITKILGFMVRIFILKKLGVFIDIRKLLKKFKKVLTAHYY